MTTFKHVNHHPHKPSAEGVHIAELLTWLVCLVVLGVLVWWVLHLPEDVNIVKDMIVKPLELAEHAIKLHFYGL